jgi:hypothetical protein
MGAFISDLQQKDQIESPECCIFLHTDFRLSDIWKKVVFCLDLPAQFSFNWIHIRLYCSLIAWMTPLFLPGMARSYLGENENP